MSDAEEVTLEEFVSRVHALIDEFKEEHIKGNEECPTKWPLKMALGQWDEQLVIFMLTKPECTEEAAGPTQGD